MIELLKILFVLFVGLVTLPVLLFVLLACCVYEFLRALWTTYQWLKEVGK